MRRFLKKSALLLGAVACFTILLHVAHADVSHGKLSDQDCGLCQTLSTTQVDVPVAIRPIDSFAGDALSLSVVRLSSDSFLIRDSRGPPLPASIA